MSRTLKIGHIKDTEFGSMVKYSLIDDETQITVDVEVELDKPIFNLEGFLDEIHERLSAAIEVLQELDCI